MKVENCFKHLSWRSKATKELESCGCVLLRHTFCHLRQVCTRKESVFIQSERDDVFLNEGQEPADDVGKQTRTNRFRFYIQQQNKLKQKRASRAFCGAHVSLLPVVGSATIQRRQTTSFVMLHYKEVQKRICDIILAIIFFSYNQGCPSKF